MIRMMINWSHGPGFRAWIQQLRISEQADRTVTAVNLHFLIGWQGQRIAIVDFAAALQRGIENMRGGWWLDDGLLRDSIPRPASVSFERNSTTVMCYDSS